MLASAFCGVLLFIAAVYGYLMWQFSNAGPGTTVRLPPFGEKTVATAPPVVDRERFFGTHASMSGEFSMASRNTVLAAGPGRITGSAKSDGKPLQGLRLRLALNGGVMSQWATTGADGRYEIEVPYGKYRVDGYELDSSSANTVLAGKTDGAHERYHLREVTDVEAAKPGRGLDFAFVDPVRKLGPRGELRLAEPVVLRWEPYAGAAAYRVQVTERKDPQDFESQRNLFEWRERPVVRATSVDLAEYKAALKKGHHYVVEIEALDERNRVLSQSPRNFATPDFRVLE